MKVDTKTLPSNRDDAIDQGSRFYFTGQPCIRGHVCARRTINKSCLECVEIRTHTDRHKELRRQYHLYHYNRPDVIQRRIDNPPWRNEASKRRMHDHYQRNRDAIRSKHRDYYKTHRAAILERTGQWVRTHRDEYRAIQRAAQARRRVLERGDVHAVSGKDFRRWVDIQAKVCFYCGVDCSSGFHVDHFMPLSKGGTHTIDNLRIACCHCNLTKQASDPYQFMYKSYSATLALLAILSNS